MTKKTSSERLAKGRKEIIDYHRGNRAGFTEITVEPEKKPKKPRNGWSKVKMPVGHRVTPHQGLIESLIKRFKSTGDYSCFNIRPSAIAELLGVSHPTAIAKIKDNNLTKNQRELLEGKIK